MRKRTYPCRVELGSPDKLSCIELATATQIKATGRNLWIWDESALYFFIFLLPIIRTRVVLHSFIRGAHKSIVPLSPKT